MPTGEAFGEPRQVLLRGRAVPYTLFRVKRQRRLRVTVSGQRGLIVMASLTMPVSEAEDFLREKAAWILRHIDKQDALAADLERFRFHDGGAALFLGAMRTIRAKRVDGSQLRVALVGDEIHVDAPAPPGAGVSEEHVAFGIGVLFARHAEAVIRPIAESCAATMGLRFGKLAFKPHKSLWGSCSAAGNLNFNQFLLMAPETVIRYIVIHELAHRVERNHGPRFWALVERYCPDATECRRWLRKHAHVLDHYHRHINVRLRRTRRAA